MMQNAPINKLWGPLFDYIVDVKKIILLDLGGSSCFTDLVLRTATPCKLWEQIDTSSDNWRTDSVTRIRNNCL